LLKRTLEDKFVDTFNYIFLTLILIVTVYPFWYVLILSFNEGKDAALGGIFLIPRKFTFENYKVFFTEPKWVGGLKNTVLRTVIGTALSTGFTAMVAYGLSHRYIMFRKTYFNLLIFSMYFGGGLIPFYVLLRGLGLLNSFWVYVIPNMFKPFMALVMISFIREIPYSLEESARIDGANDFTIFARIIVPVSKPILATMALFGSVAHWNDWYSSVYFVTRKNLKVLAFFMREVINQSLTSDPTQEQLVATYQGVYDNIAVTTRSMQMATIFIAVAPILLVYPFLQKYFIKGMTLGAVKE